MDPLAQTEGERVWKKRQEAVEEEPQGKGPPRSSGLNREGCEQGRWTGGLQVCYHLHLRRPSNTDFRGDFNPAGSRMVRAQGARSETAKIKRFYEKPRKRAPDRGRKSLFKWRSGLV